MGTDHRPLFFAHIPRSGGTTITYWVSGHLPGHAVFPTGSSHDLVAQKMFPWALRDLGRAASGIRFLAPHLPVSTHELVGADLRLACLVRDPLDQLRSILNLQGGAPSGSSLLARCAEVAMPWYVTHQLRWYLGADAGEVLTVFERAARHGPAVLGPALDDAMATVLDGEDLVDRACSRLEQIELLGLSADAAPFARAIAESLHIPPPPPDLRLNQGRAVPVPAAAGADVETVLRHEREIHRRAARIVASRSGASRRVDATRAGALRVREPSMAGGG